MKVLRPKILGRDALERALEWLRDHAEVDASGVFQVERSITGMAANQVVLGSVHLEPALAEGTRLRLIQEALGRWRQSEEHCASHDLVQCFSEALSVELTDVQKQTVLMFLNIEQPAIEALMPLTVHEAELRYSAWDVLEKHLDMEGFWTDLEVYLGHHDTPLLKRVVHDDRILYLRQKRGFQPISTELETVDVASAVAIASDALDLLRAVFNLPSALRLLWRQSSSFAALSVFLPSPVYAVFDINGNYDTLYYTPERHHYRLREVLAADLGFCRDFVAKLSSAIPGSLAHLLARSVRLYQDAFDFSNYRATYLGLWQLLEVLTLNEPDHQGRTQVDRRVACLLDLSGDEVLRDALRILRESRNSLVHRGIFPEYSDELVFTLKGIVGAMLQQVIDLTKHLDTETELREYYRLASSSDTDLARERSDIEVAGKVIDLIQLSRSET